MREMADVEITLEQMKIGLRIGFYELRHVRSEKINRLNANIDRFAKEEDKV